MVFDPEVQPHPEQILDTTHIIEARFPEQAPNLDEVRFITDQDTLEPVTTDEARFPGGSTPGLVEFSGNAGAAEFSHVIRQSAEANQNVVPVGPQTSLTGAAVPKGEVVLDMTKRKGMSELEQNERGHFITVQSGVTLRELQENLDAHGLFFPSAPTYAEATVIGAISTDGAGARSYKYGKTRNFVEELSVVLASGEVLDMKRGQYVAHEGDEEHPAGYFELRSQDEARIIPVPTYEMPDVPKVSAGYYAKPGMDLIDLFVGSEGTLGVITEAKVKVQEEPPTWMALVPCESDEQAFELTARLREQEPEKRDTLQPGGISAVEYIGSDAVSLVRDHGGPNATKPPEGNAFLLVQIEEGDEDSMTAFYENCVAVGIDDFLIAEPDDRVTKTKFIDIRESVPLTVNEQIAERKKTDPAVTKVGADPCVKPEDLGQMMDIYSEEFAEAGVEFYVWGHGEGNLHFNALPRTAEETERAKEVILKAGERIITELGGTGTAEHGVGKNIAKQLLLLMLYGEEGVNQMRLVKEALDPKNILAPGNIFTPAAQAA
jgi:D-lactate dehydrogenase (cytochrome)